MSGDKYKLNGRYEVEGELSRGPFGIVRLARDTYMCSRPVVIKTLPLAEGETFDDPWFRRKFDEQIQALDRIQHPGVVRVYEYGWTPEGEPFFVMPYIEGACLSDVLRGGALELKRAARIVGQLGSVLTAAHDVGVIHRDLKPENVILQTFRDVEFSILIDFGIATVGDLTSRRPTRETAVVGTLPYMSPEQLRGGPVPATDVWALGVVAYEMVTGRPPFDADDELTLGDMQRAGVGTMPRSLRPELPEAAQDVILKALSYDPAARYAHAHEMGDAFLRAVLVGDGQPPYPPELRHQTAPPAPESPRELLRRCLHLFELLDEFRSPAHLWPLFGDAGLGAYGHCVGRAAAVELNQLLDCLYRSGRDYRGQALLELLELLASHYKGQWQEQECEGLRSGLRQLFTQATAPGG